MGAAASLHIRVLRLALLSELFHLNSLQLIFGMISQLLYACTILFRSRAEFEKRVELRRQFVGEA